MSNPTVRKIVNEYLITNGFDGLWNCDGECACVIGELFPCNNPRGCCAAGYRVPCDCGDHDYHIQRHRIAANKE